MIPSNQCIPHRTKESLRRIAYEYCEDCARQNVVYAEYRFTPYQDDPLVCSAEEYTQGILDGLSEGQEKFGIKVRVIFCIMREAPGMCVCTVTRACLYSDSGKAWVRVQ